MKTLMMFLAFLISMAANGVGLIGTATDLKSGKIVYIEKHRITNDENGFNRLIQTDYLRPDGQTFATIKSDFSKDLYLPLVEFKDERFQITETMTFEKEARKIILTKTEKGKDVERKEFTVEENFVVGQGFNNYIKTHFDLPPESKVKINFVVLTRMNYYKFDIQQQKLVSENRKTFFLVAGNFIFKLFSHPIEVTYETQSGRLLTYKGLSNIMNDQNKSQEVLINYTESAP